MANYRSEAGKFPNKPNFKNFNMTLYPNQLDTRENNINMKGHVNVGEGYTPDFVMAEYVNSLYDAVMAVQKTLGITPMVYTDATNPDELIESFNVSQRIGRIESGLFDERYGGTGWQFTPDRPTLNSHQHTGENGHPDKIDLTLEVSNVLSKSNINLAQTANGLLGTDIKISTADSTTITAAIEDKLSKKTGGTVSGPTEFTGLLQSTYFKQYNTNNITITTPATLVSDTNTYTGKAIQSSSSAATVLLKEKLSTLTYGKYIACVRIKSNYSGSQSFQAVRFRVGGKQEQTLNVTEFSNASYRYYYYVFNHESKTNELTIETLKPVETTTITLDSVLIQPIHPSVLDR